MYDCVGVCVMVHVRLCGCVCVMVHVRLCGYVCDGACTIVWVCVCE